MNIFLDEAGRFHPAAYGDSDKRSCIVAVIINDASRSLFFEQFGHCSKKFLRVNGECVINFLRDNGCNILVMCFDPLINSAAMVQEHREWFIESIYKGIESHPIILKQSVCFYINKLHKLSNDEYIKILLQLQLLENVLRKICANSLEFSQRDLNSFNIIFDLENSSCKPIIKNFINYVMFCRSREVPIICDRKDRLTHMITSEGYLSIDLFLNNLTFCSWEQSVGVRIADVVANHVFRVLNSKIDCRCDFSQHPYSFFNGMHFNKRWETVESRDKGLKLIDSSLT
jgi:hypothetical protein